MTISLTLLWMYLGIRAWWTGGTAGTVIMWIICVMAFLGIAKLESGRS